MVLMVKIIPKGSAFMLSFSYEECGTLGLKAGCEYELSKARDGLWVLVETAAKKQEPKIQVDDTEQKIIGMLRKLPPRDRMEGWFEKKLTEEERKKFSEMLTNGAVVKFKSSEVFRKALYVPGKHTAKTRAPEKSFENKEKPFPDFTLEKDGFVVVKNEMRAKALSEELRDRIKAGEIKGTRAFTGEFYIVLSDLLESAEEKVIKEMKAAKKYELSALSAKIGLTETLVKIAMEFLKEEGQIIEKKKDSYQYIE